MPEVARFKHRLTVAHIYGTGNSFGDAESRGNDDLIARLSRQLRVDYHRLPLSKRAQSFITLVRSRARQLARKSGNLVRQRERVAPPLQRKRNTRESATRRNHGAVRQRPSSPAERGTNAATSSSSMGDGPGDGHSPIPFQPPPPASPPRRASVPLVDSSPSYRSPVQRPQPTHERMLIMAPVERSPDRSPLPARPAPAREPPRVAPRPAVE